MNASPAAASVIMSRLRHVDGYLLPELRLPAHLLVQTCTKNGIAALPVGQAPC